MIPLEQIDPSVPPGSEDPRQHFRLIISKQSKLYDQDTPTSQMDDD